MANPMVGTLLVLSIVAATIVIRYATDYTPDSLVRVWATRVAVITIILWFAIGLQNQIATRHNIFDLLTTRAFGRGILAIVLIWVIFRDEL